MKRRVVVTGMGLVSSVGDTMAASWDALLKGKSGVSRIDKDPLFSNINFEGIPKYAAKIDPNKECFKKERKSKLTVNSILYFPLGLMTASEAIKDSGINPNTLSEEEKDRFGVIIGTSLGGTHDIEKSMREPGNPGYSPVDRMTCFHFARYCCSFLISHKFQLRGYSMTTSIGYTSGFHAIGEGYRAIKNNLADSILVGGVENAVYPYILKGFSLTDTLSSGYDSDVTKSCRPFDKKRNGFVIGDGSGILILEVKLPLRLNRNMKRRRVEELEFIVKSKDTVFHVSY